MRATGFSLIELLIVLVIFTVLMGAAMGAFTTVLKTWSSQDAGLEIREDLRQGLAKAARDLRPAKAVSASDDSVRFTVNEGGTDHHYILYLYHADDSWIPAYDQAAYELRKAVLSGGIGGTFTYGDGVLYVKGVSPPPDSDLSVSGSVVTLDLTASKGEDTFHLLEKVRPRNL